MDKFIDKIINWLDDHLPVTCAMCGSWVRKMDAIYRMHRTGERLALCLRCDRRLYRPFDHD